MELEITWKRVIRVWWAYVWRNILAIIAGAVIGGIVGAIMGFVLGALGASAETIQILAMPVGLVIGLALSVIPMKLILGKNFGEFRLVLLKTES